jgi:glycosyltransferase involved in cell wall biosynthesis
VKVLVTGTSFSPAYGGPAVSVARLADALAERGVDVALWSPDGSVVSEAVVGDRVRRLGGTLPHAMNELGKPDLIHDNGIWLRHNHDIARLAHRDGIARVVSPRGMLEPWAMAHKRQKKRVAWILYQRRDLRLAARLHAATAVEAARLEALDLAVPVVVLPNGVDLPPEQSSPARDASVKTAVFLGRLYPVKGIPMLLHAWATLRPPGWRLVIAGPDEAGHEAELRSMASSMRLDDVIQFVGHVSADAKERLLASASVLVAPSHMESFGMAIAEALARGVPVLTTTATPWKVLGEMHCGWQVEPNIEGITSGLRVATLESDSTLREMGERGRDYVRRNLQWAEIADKYIALYDDALTARR